MTIAILRTAILYIVVILSLRLMGKRQIGELSPSELVVTILISNIAALPIEDISIPIVGAILPIIVLASFEIFTSGISLKSKRMRSIITGNPKIIIKNGKIDRRVMRELRYNVDDLFEELHGKDVFDLRDVETAILEPNGKLSVLKFPEKQNLTAEMMNITPAGGGLQRIIISDGKTIDENLRAIGRDDGWLQKTLKHNKVSVSDVFIMTCDSGGNYHIVKEDGQ